MSKPREAGRRWIVFFLKPVMLFPYYTLGMWQSGENGSSRHLYQKWHPKQSTPSSSAMAVVQDMISCILDRR